MSRARPRLAGAFLLLAGCMGLGRRSDPTKFFTLTPLPGSAGSEHAGDSAPLSLGLGPILLPGYLDRAQLVTRVGPSEVRFAPFDRWAEPLAESFGRTLQQDLLGVLGAQRVVLYPWSPSTRFDFRVALEVLRFEPTAEGGAELAARWGVRDGTGTTLLVTRESRLTAPAAGRDTAAAVAAMSQTLAELSAEIGRAVREQERQRASRGPLQVP